MGHRSPGPPDRSGRWHDAWWRASRRRWTMADLVVPIRRLDHALDLPLPAYATAGSAGMDLLAAVATPLTLAPMQRAIVPTGIAIELPDGIEAQVRPRSGLAARHGVTVLNAPGTVDADYRGE